MLRSRIKKRMLFWVAALITVSMLQRYAMEMVAEEPEGAINTRVNAINAHKVDVVEAEAGPTTIAGPTTKAGPTTVLGKGRPSIQPQLQRPLATEEYHSSSQNPTTLRSTPYVTTGKSRVHDIQEAARCFKRNREMPWFEKRTYSETYLVFYGKPIMAMLRKIGISRGWKIKHIPQDTPEGLRELVSPDRFIVLYTVSAMYKHKLIRDLANSSNALLGTVGNAMELSGTKGIQLVVFRDYFKNFGCSLEDTGMMPRSFILNDTAECIEFFRYARLHPQTMWILKPSAGQGGSNISIHSNITYLSRKYATCATESHDIVQEYVSNPLLVNTHKFDIRGYIFIAKTYPYLLVFYHDGYLRMSMKEFDRDGDLAVHLTNFDVQKSVEGFTNGKHVWLLNQFQSYLNHHQPADGRGFVENTLIPFIQDVGLLIGHTAKSTLVRTPSSNILMGLDFTVTSDLKMKFLEVNNYPLWPGGTGFKENMVLQIGNELFDILINSRRYPSRFQHMKPGKKYKSWTLVWNELYAKCTNTPRFDPCKEFMEV